MSRLFLRSLRPPHWRQSMLNLHAMVQKAADGDENAAVLLGPFGRRDGVAE